MDSSFLIPSLIYFLYDDACVNYLSKLFPYILPLFMIICSHNIYLYYYHSLFIIMAFEKTNIIIDY